VPPPCLQWPLSTPFPPPLASSACSFSAASTAAAILLPASRRRPWTLDGHLCAFQCVLCCVDRAPATLMEANQLGSRPATEECSQVQQTSPANNFCGWALALLSQATHEYLDSTLASTTPIETSLSQ
jgi:hypothetical protein